MKKLVFIVIATLLFSACRTITKTIEVPVEIPVEVVKKEYIHDTKIDSIYIRDSIDRWQKGDTLYITKWHTKFKYINKVDTMLKVDTLPKIISTTIEKKLEVNHIYWSQKTLMWLGGIAVILLIVVITYKVKRK